VQKQSHTKKGVVTPFPRHYNPSQNHPRHKNTFVWKQCAEGSIILCSLLMNIVFRFESQDSSGWNEY